MERKQQQRASRGRIRVALILVATLAVSAIAVGLITTQYLRVTGGSLEESHSGTDTAAASGELGSKLFDQPEPPVAAPPTAPLSESAPIVRLLIPRFDVEARVITLGVGENGVMESPDGPWDVAWYAFSGRPGQDGNAVFAGHVDWYNVGPGGGPGGAVFWNLKDLAIGDRIEVRLSDGTVFQYAVSERQQVDPATADLEQIVGPTTDEVITLITCGGSFDPITRHRDQRVIVRAGRVGESRAGAIVSP